MTDTNHIKPARHADLRPDRLQALMDGDAGVVPLAEQAAGRAPQGHARDVVARQQAKSGAPGSAIETWNK